jgi:hypothetical protein
MSKARDIASAAPAPSTVDATEIGYLNGVTSAIQTQLDAKTAKSTLTTTGDIYYASAANTPARLGIGSSAQVLTVAAGVPSWAAPAAGGKVLQVVSAVYSTAVTVSTTTYTDTGLSASITPTLNTSKILVLVSQFGRVYAGYAKEAGASLRLMRGSTEIHGPYNSTPLSFGSKDEGSNSGGFHLVGVFALQYLDSPATTSSTTYKMQVRLTAGDSYGAQEGSGDSSIILMEIGA